MLRSSLRNGYDLLSSMRFAITLLTILAISSMVGTVLKQNEPYNAYLNQFGPFWFPVFETLGLYSVYNSAWFLVILGFLVLSTALCIVRQTAPMLRDMRSFREHAKASSLNQFAHQGRLQTELSLPEAQQRAETYLASRGFRFRSNLRDNGVLVAAKQGSLSRLGYFFAHGAIVLICLGGLLDGNLPLKIQMALGDKVTTTGNQLIANIKPDSRLGLGNWSYRGNVFIPEGKSSNVAILNIKDGILLQDLPFTVSLKKFHLDHYPTGMPKRFASDIILTDPVTGQSIEKTIEVNKPFEFKGVMLYQASFEDGGSKLKLIVRSLLPGNLGKTSTVEAEVGESLQLTHPRFQYTLEVVGFRPFNVENLAEADANPTAASRLDDHLGSGAKPSAKKDLRNVGPSYQYKLRDSTGQAREYQNYMSPMQQDGRWFLLTGMRGSPSQPFRFLRMPLDEDQKIDTWLALRNLLLDPDARALIAQRFTKRAMSGTQSDAATVQRLNDTTARTLQIFASQGFESLGKFIEASVPKAEQEKAADVLIKVLEGASWEAWMLLRERAGMPLLELTPTRGMFIRDTLNSTSDSLHYGAPVYLQLDQYQEVRATVLQATRSPGKPIVYLGSLLLTLGVFAMLYIRERRLFVLIEQGGQVLVALSSNRKSLDLNTSLQQHLSGLARELQAVPAAQDPAHV